MPVITFSCPHCQQSIQMPEELAGKSATCCFCQQIIEVPKRRIGLKQPGAPANPQFSSAQGMQPNFVPAQCPSCGGALQVPKGRDRVICMYCGNSILLPSSQAIPPSQQQNYENILELARAALLQANLPEAYGYYMQVLERDTENVEAWLGRAVCEAQPAYARDPVARAFLSDNQIFNSWKEFLQWMTTERIRGLGEDSLAIVNSRILQAADARDALKAANVKSETIILEFESQEEETMKDLLDSTRPKNRAKRIV